MLYKQREPVFLCIIFLISIYLMCDLTYFNHKKLFLVEKKYQTKYFMTQ